MEIGLTVRKGSSQCPRRRNRRTDGRNCCINMARCVNEWMRTCGKNELLVNHEVKLSIKRWKMNVVQSLRRVWTDWL